MKTLGWEDKIMREQRLELVGGNGINIQRKGLNKKRRERKQGVWRWVIEHRDEGFWLDNDRPTWGLSDKMARYVDLANEE